jgi:hypothetical protein
VVSVQSSSCWSDTWFLGDAHSHRTTSVRDPHEHMGIGRERRSARDAARSFPLEDSGRILGYTSGEIDDGLHAELEADLDLERMISGTTPSKAPGGTGQTLVERSHILWMRRVRVMGAATLCLAALLTLGGCNLPDLGSADVDTDITAPPSTPRATATPWAGAPRQLPAR